jgi:hypothetical protein
MANTFRRRLSNIIDYIVSRELDKAEQEYNYSARFGNSNQRAFDRLRRLTGTLDDLGRTGRRIAASKGLPTDDAWTDKLPGGKADGKAPSDFDEKALQKGQKVELEHTDDYDTALEIAMDHITELGNEYYPELDKMEKKLKDKEADDENMGNQTIGDNPLMSPVNEELPPTGKSLNAPSRRPGPYAKRA